MQIYIITIYVVYKKQLVNFKIKSLQAQQIFIKVIYPNNNFKVKITLKI